jgi:PAS domain S-box-containing protein
VSARYYLIFIIFSFLVSLSISLFVVNKRVETSVSSVLEKSTLSSSALTTSMIEQYIQTRVQLAKDLASQPILISSVMGAADTTGRLKDFIESVSLLGKKEYIGLFDILGESIYSNFPKPLLSGEKLWLNELLNERAQSAIFLVGEGDEANFAIALPIRYNDKVEGVLLVNFSSPVREFINPLVTDKSDRAVRLSGPYLTHTSEDSLEGYTLIQESNIVGTNLKVSYLIDQERVRQDQVSTMLTITLSIISGLALSFLALAFLGKRLLLNPYKRLETLQVETENTLRELENLNFAVDQHSIVAVTDIKGTILFANQKFSDVSGYANDELIGQNHRILNSGYHPRSFFTEMYKTISTGKIFRADICNRAKDGHLYWVDSTITPLKNRSGKIDRYIAIRSDITKLKEVEAQLASDSLRMQLATNASGIGIWEWDLKSNELVWDDWMFSLYGISPSSFSSTYEAWQACLHPEDLESSQQQLQDAVEGKRVFDPEFRVIHPNGEVRTLKAKAQVFRDENNQAIKMIGVNYDITDRVDMLKMASEARDRAQKAAEAKSEFLANMSHEIRTPMNGVIGMLELLKQTKMDKDQAHKVKVAASSAQSLLTLLNDILDLSKIEAGKLELEHIPFNLNQLLSDSVEALSNLIEDTQSTQLLIDIVGLDRNIVVGDPGRIRQIVTNLLSNAIKFTSKGEIVLKASLKETNTGQYRLTCSVRDSGIGIPEDKLSTLFQQFTQVDASTTRKYGGTGLGLSITKHLCHLMDGEIFVTSEEGKGSCFTFDIEVGIPEDKERIVYPASLDEMKVLLIDQNFVSRSIHTRQFEAWGINLTAVESHRSALQELETSQDGKGVTFNVVIMDTQDCAKESIEFCSKLEQLDNISELKLILLLASGQSQHAFIGLSSVKPRFIKKPVIPSLIMDMLIETNVGENGLPESTDLSEKNRSINKVLEENHRRIFKEEIKVLLVEDNQINQLVAQSLLSAYGLQVVIANNGKEAIDILANDSSPLPFSLALMDCHMPEMDGYEATKNIRSGNAGRQYIKLPVVAMTANAMQGDREKCLAAGMDDYVTKPINETLLQNALLKWVKTESDRENDTAYSLAVWNRKTLLDRLSGDEEKLKSIITNYVASSDSQKKHLVTSIEQGDLSKLERLASSIKSSLDSLGGEKLAAVLAELEKAARERDLTMVEIHVGDFAVAYLEFTDALNDYLKQIQA